ncbi:ATP-binding protein [Chitinophaga filiformis]|uniref:ATP-binding protein n=1 Tax=Chitinophaga filiformis TaxID=104663 RepID=UPI001F308823|nr:ATP-binding protein [Chitinophaga filiformis]MCF6403167.1 ATP-binding protein [Chitinophaga filiformis]
MNNKNSFVKGSLFEEDYLIKTLGPLGTSSEVALTELVSNAWDAGATEVRIFIPERSGDYLTIEDNGMGLTPDEFENRWMKLGYNRLKHQGKNVVFPPGVEGNRLAYGRNGIGRHGLLCFNNEYTVVTHSNGKKSTFIVTTESEEQPFVIKEKNVEQSDTYGTVLKVLVTRNLPQSERILQIISARFLHDPQFRVLINRQSVQLSQHTGLIDTSVLRIDDKTTLKAHFLDSKQSARSTIYQGIAFWQSNKLVGEPSWSLGGEIIIDGRTKFAKRYTIVVETNDLADYIIEDWTGFKSHPYMEKIYEEVVKYVKRMLATVADEYIEDTKQHLKSTFHEEIAQLTPLGKYEVIEAIDSITSTHPTARHETVSIAVQAIINLEKTRSGKELLVRLASLSEDDFVGLGELLQKWSVKDALVVLNEIDNRISLIEAIRKLSSDPGVDELHVLHPLVSGARWLFGPEFESAEYSSNRQLQTAVEQVFKKKIDPSVFLNNRKRPDIVLLKESTASITGTEIFDNDSGLASVNKVLIIELKRGGFNLTREERNQAQGYVEDFMNCGSLIGSPYIEAFVIGKSFAKNLQPIATVKNANDVEMGKIRLSTFSQLVDTAEKRLFGLRSKLNERYDDISGMELFKSQATQLTFDL